MKLNRLAIAIALIAGLAGSARATDAGYASTDAGHAFWDAFASASFSGASATVSDDSAFTATLSASSGMVTGAGDRLYDFGAASSFTISGSANDAIDSLTLQLKFSAPASGEAFASTFFTIDSDLGAAFTQTFIGTADLTTSQGSTTYYIYAWTWTGLDLQAGDGFTLTATGGANGHVSLDGLRVDAAAVPEPSAFAALAGLGALGLVAARRRRA